MMIEMARGESMPTNRVSSRPRLRTAAVFTVVSLALPSAMAQTPASVTTDARAAGSFNGRTVWGDPDLQGTWDFTTITPLQRPSEFAGREFLTESEATATEKQINQQRFDTEARS